MPAWQNSQAPQALNIQGTPTASPTLKSVTPPPSAATCPATSWPGISGSTGPGVQSPSTAWRSLWQTPQAATLIRISPRRGSGMGRVSIASLVPIFRSTAAFIVFFMLFPTQRAFNALSMASTVWSACSILNGIGGRTLTMFTARPS